MAIERTGVRLTIAEQLSRNPAFRGRPLALEKRDPVSGRILRASEVLAAGAKGLNSVIASAASRALAIIKPEMVTSARLSFNIMKNPVTVAMFRQFVEESGYKIVGHNAKELTALLADPKKSDQALTYVSYKDATAFVDWREGRTGQKLRIPADELLAAKSVVGNQLTGNLWEWTRLVNCRCRITRIICSLRNDDQHDCYPEDRCGHITLRLVEDKKVL